MEDLSKYNDTNSYMQIGYTTYMMVNKIKDRKKNKL